MELTGICAWLALWQFRRIGRMAKGIQGAVLILGMITLGAMTDAATIGGEIRHPEILTLRTPRRSMEPVPPAASSTRTRSENL